MHFLGEPSKQARTEVLVTFDNSDLKGVKFPHDDPLVIMSMIGYNKVKRVLVDNGAFVDIKIGYSDS